MYHLTVFIFVTGIAGSSSDIARYPDSYTLTCPLVGVKYPKWTGPSKLANPLTTLGSQNISEEGFTVVNEKDLRIDSVWPKHNGTYYCSDGANTESVQLEVYYNSGFYRISASQTANDYGYMDFSCKLDSHPDSVIEWKNVMSGYTITKTKCTTTDIAWAQFPNTCQSTLRVSNVTKEDNGKPISCSFTYSDGQETSTHEMTSKMTFEFAPKDVNLTKTKYESSGRTLYRTVCSADSSYPQAKLQWRKAGEVVTYLSTNRYKDEDFNGFSSTSEINIDEATEREGIECCAIHKRLENPLCTGLNVSGTVSITTHLLMLVTCLIMSLLCAKPIDME